MKARIGLILFFILLAGLTYGQKIEMVANINTTPEYWSGEGPFFVFQDNLYLSVYDNTLVFDGTNPVSNAYNIESIYPYVFNNKLYFRSYTSYGKNNFWVYDGKNPPVLLANFEYSGISEFCTFNNKLYFSASDKSHGAELWVYDGSGPPSLVADIDSGQPGSNPDHLMVFNNRLYFTANNKELWEYDGYNMPSKLMFEGDFYINSLTLFNNSLYIVADHNWNYQLWKYDEVNEPVLLETPSLQMYKKPVVFLNKIYFNAFNDSTKNYNLWEYDGINNPTNANELRNKENKDYPSDYQLLNNKLYIHYKSGVLWSFDGDSSLVKTSVNSTYDLTEYKGLIYFKTPASHNPTTLWQCDGINPAERLSMGATQGSDPYYKFSFNDKLYFHAKDGVHGENLWVYDGKHPPSRISDIDLYSSETNFFKWNNKLFLINDRTLWQINSKDSLVKVLYLGYWNDLYIFSNQLYFTSTINRKYGIWKFDGINPPEFVAEENSQVDGFRGISYATFNNTLYFNAFDSIHGEELWAYDGTNPATMLPEVNNSSWNAWPLQFKVFRGKLYYTAPNGTSGIGIWAYDGVSSPVLIKDIYITSPNFHITPRITEFNNKLFFTGQNADGLSELWEYDGSSMPSVVQGDYCNTNDKSYPRNFFIYNNKLIFESIGKTIKYGLWEYDDKKDPELLMNIDNTTYPHNFNVLNNTLYFLSNNENGLWQYDGRHKPEIVKAQNSNLYYSYEGQLAVMNNKLYFSGALSVTGSELMVLTPPDSTIYIERCKSYTFNDSLLQNSGVYNDILKDRTTKLYLTIGQTSGFSSLTGCNSYVSPSGRYTWTNSGSYMDTIPAAEGCDSVITVSLHIDHVIPIVISEGPELISLDTLAHYLWIDCDNWNLPVEGETSRTFTAARSGHYAVVVSNGVCRDTSAIHEVIINIATGLVENTFESDVRLYPNPTEGDVSIDLGKAYADVNVTITGPDGRIVQKDRLKQAKVFILKMPEPAGVYLVDLTSVKDRAVFRIVKR